jgi:glyoxylase-like metal-dependent hydrolase (beta-lactamase superfamily II)/rhodanese-related sulfurtransferase
VFGVAGMTGAYVGGRLAGLVPGGVLLTAFAVMMLATAGGMIRGRRGGGGTGELHPVGAVGLGVAVGLVTGFVGAGGGFLIVPALVLIGGLPMTAAVGTSLLVITMQSAAGLAGHLSGAHLPWSLALAVTAMAIVGSLIGGRLTGRVDQEKLRRGFGWLVVAMGLLVLAEQVPHRMLAAGWPWLVVALAATWLATVLTRAVRQEGTATATPGEDTPGGSSSTSATVPDPATGRPSNPLSSRPPDPQETTMHFTQYYLDCLSQASYLIGDTTTGQAVVVDPRRDVAEYLDDAAAAGLRIIGMINTHFHADFLSGHLELAKATGAWIGYGRVAQAEFETRSLADGERIVLGDVVLQIMQTPGHTPESISVLVFEHADDEVAYGVLTGDALFIGDVGRPDLLASIGVTAQELGVQLYDSIQHKLMGLPDAVRVFPAHGAGSACGKNLSTERQSTIGAQRVLNYACQPMSREQFVALVTAGQPSAPEYFVYDAILNRKDRDLYDADVPVAALEAAGLDAALGRGAVLLDARTALDFAAGHLAGSINVPADGRFAETVGMVLRPDQEIVVLAPDARQGEVAVRLARIGFDQVTGYLPDAEALLVERAAQVERASRLTPVQLAELTAADRAESDIPVVLDVRNIGERDAGHVPGSIHIPLAELARRIDEIPTDQPIVAYCAGGWRSSVAASLLRHTGRPDVSDLLGGFAAWQAMNEPVTT